MPLSHNQDMETLINLLAHLPGLGPRSARRVALYILSHKERVLAPLQKSLAILQEKIALCETCFMISTQSPCAICSDNRRDHHILCVVEETSDVWALERASAHQGHYHVLGGALNPLEGLSPENLHIEPLIQRVSDCPIDEIILATNTTIDGQTTAHYLAERLKPFSITLSRLARGLPIGSELDYMDDGTIIDAVRQRQPFLGSRHIFELARLGEYIQFHSAFHIELFLQFGAHRTQKGIGRFF